MAGADDELRILVLAPTGRDALLVTDMLGKAGLAAGVCKDLEQFSQSLQDGAGAGLLADEALSPKGVQKLFASLSGQPAWSDIPLMLLTTGGSRASDSSTGLIQALGEHANITILERPVRPPTLMSAIRSALRARRRQYEVRDHIAERQRNEEKLRETAKLESLGVLAGGIAHDFNNLLVGMMGNASLVLDGLPRGDHNRPLLENVVRASERAADLTRQLLAYSGKGSFIIQPVDISALIREIVRLMNTTLSGAVELRLDLRDIPPVEADESQIQQLVMNLVINAAEAIGNEPGSVTVRTDVREIDGSMPRRNGTGELKPGKYVCLEVIDTGSGMDEAIKSRIFGPFFTTKFTGRGLGLSAVLGIVRGHHGAIQVESTPGQGSRFSVLFPAASGQAAAPENAETSTADLRGRSTILVVDDEEIVRDTARTTLGSYGYTVLEASTGREAIKRVREHGETIAAVLLDLTMPVMSGAETFRKLREMRPELPVILLSGLSEIEAEQRFANQGLAGFLQKPYTAAILARKIKSVALAPA